MNDLAQECADYATSLRSTANVIRLEGRPAPASFLRAAELFERAATGLRESEAERRELLARQVPEEWVPLSDEDRTRAFNSLPDMLDGFLKKWGWLHFAKAIEAECRAKNAPSPTSTD